MKEKETFIHFLLLFIIIQKKIMPIFNFKTDATSFKTTNFSFLLLPQKSLRKQILKGKKRAEAPNNKETEKITTERCISDNRNLSILLCHNLKKF